MKLTYELPIRRVREIADQTFEVSFDKSGTDFNFKSGQYVSVIFPELEEISIKDAYHEFSIASAVDDPMLKIAFRASGSPFKKKLLSKNVGEAVIVEGPFGVFYPHADAVDVVYIAGGIGITAFSSSLLAGQVKNQRVRVYTFDKTETSSPYRKELFEAAEKNGFELHQYIGPAAVEHLTLQTDQHANILIAGPNGFVQTVRQILLGMGIMKDNIQTEEFTGYA